MIYLVEDDDSIRSFVIYALNSQGMEARALARPSDFWKAMEQRLPDLELLDIMLPEEDGLHILKRLRDTAATARLPVMMLTAKGSEFDRVVGLDAGADDYLPKPFGIMELLARIRALLRRTGEEQAPMTYTVGELVVCPSKHLVEVGGKPCRCLLKEFELLCALRRSAARCSPRAQMLDRIWGYEFDGETRTVDVHIRTLRQKLGPCGDLIETVRGVGYKIGEDRP